VQSDRPPGGGAAARDHEGRAADRRSGARAALERAGAARAGEAAYACDRTLPRPSRVYFWSSLKSFSSFTKGLTKLIVRRTSSLLTSRVISVSRSGKK